MYLLKKKYFEVPSLIGFRAIATIVKSVPITIVTFVFIVTIVIYGTMRYRPSIKIDVWVELFIRVASQLILMFVSIASSNLLDYKKITVFAKGQYFLQSFFKGQVLLFFLQLMLRSQDVKDHTPNTNRKLKLSKYVIFNSQFKFLISEWLLLRHDLATF